MTSRCLLAARRSDAFGRGGLSSIASNAALSRFDNSTVRSRCFGGLLDMRGSRAFIQPVFIGGHPSRFLRFGVLSFHRVYGRGGKSQNQRGKRGFSGFSLPTCGKRGLPESDFGFWDFQFRPEEGGGGLFGNVRVNRGTLTS